MVCEIPKLWIGPSAYLPPHAQLAITGNKIKGTIQTGLEHDEDTDQRLDYVGLPWAVVRWDLDFR